MVSQKSHPFISVSECCCPHLIWCLHKLNMTPAALGIATLRESEAEGGAVVSSSLNSKAFTLKGDSLAFPALHTSLLFHLIVSWHYPAQTESCVSVEMSVTVWKAR